MATFSFTDRIIQKLDEDIFKRSSSEFDAGLDKSIINKAWGTGFTLPDFIKRLLGPGGTPEQLVGQMSKELDTDTDNNKYLSNLLFNNIKTVPVFLPHILITNKAQQQEVSEIPKTTQAEAFSYNYTYDMLMEASLHNIGNNFFQAMDSSHRVFFTYKGQLATVEPSKTFNSFIQNISGTIGHGQIHTYVIDNMPKIISMVKQDILSKLTNDIDKSVVKSVLDQNQMPTILQNASAVGILDVANLSIQVSPKAFVPTSNSVADLCLKDKDSIIYSQFQVQNAGYSGLDPALKSDLVNKITSSQHLAANIYKKDNSLQLFLKAYEMGKKNPHSTYRKVYKMDLTVFNWMVNDLNKSVFKSQTKNSEIYFSSPTQQDIHKHLGASPKKDTMPFVVIRAVGTEDSEFAAEFRCFAVENSKTKDATYSGIPGVTKASVITNGFNSYITNRANEESQSTDINAYLEQLNSIQPGESSAHMSYTEGAKVMWAALRNSYVGNGKFQSKILFKYVPELLSQAQEAGVTIYTSMKDLSTSELPFVNSLNGHDDQFLVSKVADHAAMLLVNPIDKTQGKITGVVHQVDLYDTEVNKIQSDFILHNDFIALEGIKTLLLERLDNVTSLNELLEVSSIFSAVVRNLARGFWTATGSFELAGQLNNGNTLGLFNILKSDSFSVDDKTMDLGVIGGSINLRSLGFVKTSNPLTGESDIRDTGDSRLFTDARLQATDHAVKSVATFIGGR